MRSSSKSKAKWLRASVVLFLCLMLLCAYADADIRYHFQENKSYAYALRFSAKSGSSVLEVNYHAEIQCLGHSQTGERSMYNLSLSIGELLVTDATGQYANLELKKGLGGIGALKFSARIDDHGSILETNLGEVIATALADKGPAVERAYQFVGKGIFGSFWRRVLPELAGEYGSSRTMVIVRERDWTDHAVPSNLAWSSDFFELALNIARRTEKGDSGSALLLWCKVTKVLFSKDLGDAVDESVAQDVKILLGKEAVTEAIERNEHVYSGGKSIVVTFSAVLEDPTQEQR